MRRTTFLIDGEVEWLTHGAPGAPTLRELLSSPEVDLSLESVGLARLATLSPEVIARRAEVQRQRYINDPSLRFKQSQRIKTALAAMSPEAKAQKSARQRQYHSDPVGRAKLSATVKAMFASETREKKAARYASKSVASKAAWTPERREAQRVRMIELNRQRSKSNQ